MSEKDTGKERSGDDLLRDNTRFEHFADNGRAEFEEGFVGEVLPKSADERVKRILS